MSALEQIEHLPDSPEEAFVQYERAARERLSNTGGDLNNYAETEYCNAILAFIDEYQLDIDVPRNESEFVNFFEYFNQFVSRVDYWKHRYTLRARRSGLQPPILLKVPQDCRAEIHKCIDKIRKIINSSNLTENKKEALFSHLSALSREVDRENTRIDGLVRIWLQLTKAVGDGAENLEPAIRQVEKLAKIFSNSPESTFQISHQKQKQLEDQSTTEEQGGDDLDDEIPF